MADREIDSQEDLQNLKDDILWKQLVGSIKLERTLFVDDDAFDAYRIQLKILEGVSKFFVENDRKIESSILDVKLENNVLIKETGKLKNEKKELHSLLFLRTLFKDQEKALWNSMSRTQIEWDALSRRSRWQIIISHHFRTARSRADYRVFTHKPTIRNRLLERLLLDATMQVWKLLCDKIHNYRMASELETCVFLTVDQRYFAARILGLTDIP